MIQRRCLKSDNTNNDGGKFKQVLKGGAGGIGGKVKADILLSTLNDVYMYKKNVQIQACQGLVNGQVPC